MNDFANDMLTANPTCDAIHFWGAPSGRILAGRILAIARRSPHGRAVLDLRLRD